jgi:hypothetical protein
MFIEEETGVVAGVTEGVGGEPIVLIVIPD